MSSYNLPASFIERVENALRQYEDEVDASKLSLNSKETYKLHANNFVRWMRGDFTPGGNL